LPSSRIETVMRTGAALDTGRRAGFVHGDDIVAAGLPQGPGVGDVLRAVEDAVGQGSIRDREAALALVRQLVADRVKLGGRRGR
jgi:hypothetical protein